MLTKAEQKSVLCNETTSLSLLIKTPNPFSSSSFPLSLVVHDPADHNHNGVRAELDVFLSGTMAMVHRVY